MNTTASTYVRYKTTKKTYMYENGVSMCTKTERQNENNKFTWCENSFPCASLHCEQQHHHLIPVASEIFNCSFLSFHFTSASLHVWHKLVMMQLHVTAPSWHDDTELNWGGKMWDLTDKKTRWDTGSILNIMGQPVTSDNTAYKQKKIIPSRLAILNMQGKKKWGKEEITTVSSISSAGSCFKASSFNTETTQMKG